MFRILLFQASVTLVSNLTCNVYFLKSVFLQFSLNLLYYNNFTINFLLISDLVYIQSNIFV